jgi:endonuclease/exonuclease/phosphatase family metal-dependent hydrolase
MNLHTLQRFKRALCVAILALGSISPSLAAKAAAPLRLRILSYNIHHAEGLDGKLDLERIAGIIRTSEADLVALQEVDRNTVRCGKVDQPAELARLTGLHAAFGRNIPYEGGQYGNAVLSRWPIKRHENHPLPMLTPGERRGLLEVEIELPESRSLVFFATHLDHRPGDRDRIASAEAINLRAAESKAPLAILAGDLNAVPASKTLEIFKSAWTIPAANSEANDPPLLTSPAQKPRRQIDYILLRPQQRWKVIDVRVLDEPVASDHRPLLATVELPAQ